jgi:biopolymer transport protein ExbD
VTLRLAGERLPDQRLFFDIEPPGPRPRFSATVRIEVGGRVTWNGEAIDLDGLRTRVRAMDRRRVDDVAVAPASDADFITFYEAVHIIGQGKTMPTLLGCRGTTGSVNDPSVC